MFFTYTVSLFYFFSFTLRFRPSFLLSIGMTVFFVQFICTLHRVHAFKPFIFLLQKRAECSNSDSDRKM